MLVSGGRLQYAITVLAVNVFVGARHVAASKPHADLPGFNDYRRVADHLRIPRLIAGKQGGRFFPMHAVARASQAEAAVFVAVAAGVKHPVVSIGCPNRGLAETVLVKRSEITEFEHRIGAQLAPG